MKRLPWLAVLLLAGPLHAQTVVGPPGVYTVPTKTATTVEYGDGFVKISWAALPDPTPQPQPTPDPTPQPPVPPAPTPPPPGPVKHADWLVMLFDADAMTPDLADIRNSATLRGALAPTKVTSFVSGTPDFARYQPYLTAKGLKAPVYLFINSDQSVLGSGAVTTEADILEAAAKLR